MRTLVAVWAACWVLTMIAANAQFTRNVKCGLVPQQPFSVLRELTFGVAMAIAAPFYFGSTCREIGMLFYGGARVGALESFLMGRLFLYVNGLFCLLVFAALILAGLKKLVG